VGELDAVDKYTVGLAFGLTLFAGLSTGIGSAMVCWARKTNTRFLAVSLGFSAGVMLYVSLVDIIRESEGFLVAELGKGRGEWLTAAAFFAGVFIIGLIDKLVPSQKNPHEAHRVESLQVADGKADSESGKIKLLRMGLFTALAIAIHNFPEGIAAFTASLQSTSLGIPIAIAIAIHNIPEGIAVAVPVYYATGNRRKAFKYSLASGLSEPLGALLGFVLFSNYMNDIFFGVIFAAVAGIMVFISIDELLPAAKEYDQGHLPVYGVFAGMAVMAISLLLFH